MHANGAEAAIVRYREAGTKKDARNRNFAQMGSAYLGVLLYHNLIYDLKVECEFSFSVVDRGNI